MPVTNNAASPAGLPLSPVPEAASAAGVRTRGRRRGGRRCVRTGQPGNGPHGALHLEAVQVLLPVQGLDPSSRPPYAPVPSMRTIHWFGQGDPRSRTRVEVSANSGQDPSIPTIAQQLTDHLGHLDQGVFVCTSYDVGSPETELPPPFDDSFWNGPPLHGVTLRGELAEWSLDAIGWLGETLADSVARHGVCSPLLLTVTQTP
jgi:hypothetical protein